MIESMLADVIVCTVEKELPRGSGKAMLVDFRMAINYDKEEGYRHFDLLIYRPTNYTRVCTRQRWDVIPVDDLVFDEDGESYVRLGASYNKGESEWSLVSDHDSGWRDGILTVLRDNARYFTAIDNRDNDWYKVFVPDFKVPSYGDR